MRDRFNAELYSYQRLFSLLGKDGSIVVCISPLSAIMVEQTEKFNTMGIKTEFIGEAQDNPCSRRRVLNGEAQLVFISPENAIQNSIYRNMFLSDQCKHRLVALAVDEAHCVRTW